MTLANDGMNGKTDWVSELEYPEWTVKEVGRFLQY